MTTSEFKKFQEDPCIEEDGFEIVGGEECRDCTPNPNAFVPDWRQQELGVPFKNEKTCQYCVVLTTDADGQFVNAENIQQRLEQEMLTDQTDEQATMVRLGNSMSFNEEAYGIFLSEYGKLDPRGPLVDENGFEYHIADEQQRQHHNLLIDSIVCEEALLTTSQTISIGTPFKFLVCVPCESIDSLEDVPNSEDLNTFFADSEVVLDGRKLYAQLVRLSFTLSTFARYTSNTDEFTVNTRGTKSPFTPDIYGDRGASNVFGVYSELRSFLNENDYGIGINRVFQLDLAEEIKIIFDNSDPEKPFVISKIFAKKKYCDFTELTKSKSLLNQGLFVDQTVMGYISKVPQIDEKLRAPQPVTWIDFLLDYTFPQLEIINDTGEIVDSLEDAPVSAFFANSMDKAFNLVTSTMSDVISETFNEWSKRNCAMTREFGSSPADDPDLFDFQQVEAQWNSYLNSDDSFLSIYKHIKNGENIPHDQKASVEIMILKAMGLCGMNALTEKAIRCLLRGLSLNEFLKAQAKVYLKKMEPSAIGLLSQTLPFSVSEEITSAFIEDFGNAPLPWETDYSLEGRQLTKDQAKLFYGFEQNRQIQDDIGQYNLLDYLAASSDYDEEKAKWERQKNEAYAQYRQEVLEGGDIEFEQEKYDVWPGNPDPDGKNLEYLEQLRENRDNLYNTTGLADYYESQADINIADFSGPSDDQLGEMGYDTRAQYDRDVEMTEKLKFKSDNKLRRELDRASFDQATLYRPGPNLQAALTDAYVDQLLNYIGISDLQRVLDNIPDVVPLVPIGEALKCPFNSLFSPPIKRFLGTTELNTAFDCNEGNSVRRPFLPKLEATNIKHAISKNLWEALKKSVSDATLKLLMGLLKLAVETLDEAVCNVLGGLGDNLINGLNGGGDDGFFDVMADAFAANPDLPQNARNLKDGTMNKVLDNYGIRPNDCPELNQQQVTENYNALYRAIGYSLSIREMKELFSYRIEEYNPLVLARVRQSISTHADCFSDTFNNNQSIGKFFRDIGSSIPLSKKNEIRESILAEDTLTPVFTSICLSQQQYDKWFDDRVRFLTSLGIPEDIATENVLGEDKNNSDSLGKLLDANSDLDSFIEDNIANKLGINDGPLFDDKGNLIDPSCYPKGGLLDTNSEDVAEATDKVSSAYFDSIEMTLVKDLTMGSMFSDGLLDMIMANTDNDGYSSHSWKSKFPFYRKTRFEGYEDTDSDEVPKKADIFYPKTIGARYYEETSEDVTFDSNLSIPNGESTPTFTMEYEQDWDTNFETKTSRLLQKRTSKTELILNSADEEMKFSLDRYNIYNYRDYVNNKSGEGPEESAPPETILELTQEIDPSIREYLQENYDLTSEQEYPLRSRVFNDYLVSSFKDIDIDLISEMDTDFYSFVYGKTSELVFNGVKDMCYNDLAGSMNTGFTFGYDPEEELTEQDINYVDPEPGSLAYTKRRSEKILGRSQTNHPRVYFLDPEKHGGSYIRPRIYIEPPSQNGWMGLRAAIIPEIDGCEPSRQVIVNMRDIKKYVNDTKSKIARDKRLNNASDCIKHIPFDMIMAQQSRAQIEAAIKALLRIYSTESYIHTSPIFTSVFSGFSGNYDDSLFEMISQDIVQDMSGRSGLMKSLISNSVYVNTFLEQCVQMYSRKYYSGELEISEEALQALTRIEESQMRYKYPSDQWLKDYFESVGSRQHTYLHREPTLDDMPYETYFDVPDSMAASDELKEDTQKNIIQNFYLNALLYDDQGEKMFLPPEEGEAETTVSVDLPAGNLNVFIKKANKFFRFFTRMYTVRVMRDDCMVIFRELLKEEFRYIMNSMANSLDAKADVFRVNQHLSTRNNIFYGNNTNFGTLESVLESSIRGEITSINNNVNENYFDNIGLSEDQLSTIKTKGCFIIQKYFKVIEKEGSEDNTTSEVLSSRSIDLYNMANPESFLEFINSPLPEDSGFSFDSSLLISDLFGSLEIIYGIEGQELVDGVIIDTETGEEAEPLPEDFPEDQLIPLGMAGEAGIKKGIRLLYVPPEGYYTKTLEANPDLDRIREQIEAQDYAITPDALSSPDYAGISGDYLGQKAFLVSPYVSEDNESHASLSLAIPITSVEIDEFDQELINLENFSDDDYKCLLTKLVNTDEYKMLFDYSFPVDIYVGLNMVHTSRSLYMSIGQGESERLKHDGFFGGKELSETPRRGQPDDDILDSLDDTKDLLRNVFANIYTSEDFQKTFEFNSDMEKLNLLNFSGLLLPSLRRIGGHKKARRPFNKDGGECESPVGKLFGGK